MEVDELDRISAPSIARFNLCFLLRQAPLQLNTLGSSRRDLGSQYTLFSLGLQLHRPRKRFGVEEYTQQIGAITELVPMLGTRAQDLQT